MTMNLIKWRNSQAEGIEYKESLSYEGHWTWGTEKVANEVNTKLKWRWSCLACPEMQVSTC